MKLVISLTVGTEGKLPTGPPLQDAIAQVDAATHSEPAYSMIDCAYPLHFTDVLTAHESWIQRIRGIRANASTRSHAELNNSVNLDDANPQN